MRTWKVKMESRKLQDDQWKKEMKNLNKKNGRESNKKGKKFIKQKSKMEK